MRQIFVSATLLSALMLLNSCGYNKIQGLDEDVKAAWSEVENQYKRRADLIPNLVNTVKGFAAHEKETLQSVVEARAKATNTTLNVSDLSTPGALGKFQEAQGMLSQALSRLMVVVEKYPDLKANQNFIELQAELAGTENRITVARGRFIKTVAEFNKLVRFFPTNLTAKYLLKVEPKETFKTDEASKDAPKVEF